MSTLKLAFNTDTMDARILDVATPIPSGFTNLGSFTHDAAEPSVNHVLWHHVRDMLYFRGVTDMSLVQIYWAAEGAAPEPEPDIVLKSLTITPQTANPALNAVIGDITPNSVITAVASDDTQLFITGNSLIANFSANGTVIVTLTETLAGAINSPKQTSKEITVTGVVPPPLPMQVVGSRGEINAIEGGAITSSNQKQLGRTRQYIGTQAVDELVIASNGFYVDTATSANNQVCAEMNASNDYTVRYAIEINGVTKRVTFDQGNLEKVVTAGSALTLSDPLLASEFGMTEFPAQMEFWIRAEREFLVGQKGMFHQTATNNPAIAGERFMVAVVGATSQLMGTGELSTANGWTAQSHLWFPYAVLGRPKKKMVAYATFGASIENGVGDGQGDGLNGAGGYMRRMLANVGGKKLARIHLAKSGETAKSWLANSAKRRVMLEYVNHVATGHNGNDYSTGETLANTQSRNKQQWALDKAFGAHVTQFAFSPKTDGTWTTLEGQTPRTGFAVGGAYRDAGNTWYGQQVAADENLDDFINLGDVQTASTARDKWRVDLGTPTTDGTHPAAVIAAVMATEAASKIATRLAAYEA